MQEIPYLLSLSPVADVAQLAPQHVGQQPVGEDALIHLAHLPGPRDDPASVDDGATIIVIGRPITEAADPAAAARAIRDELFPAAA